MTVNVFEDILHDLMPKKPIEYDAKLHKNARHLYRCRAFTAVYVEGATIA